MQQPNTDPTINIPPVEQLEGEDIDTNSEDSEEEEEERLIDRRYNHTGIYLHSLCFYYFIYYYSGYMKFAW